MIYPSEGADKLGLNVVLSRLTQHLSGEGTRVRLTEFLTFESVEEVRSELEAVAELQRCLEFDDPLHFNGLPDVARSLEKVPPVGSALDTVEIYSIGLFLDLASRVERFFHLRLNKYPLINGILEGTSAVDSPSEAIFSAIDESGEFKDGASSELRKIRRNLVSAHGRARRSASEALKWASGEGYAADDQPTIRAGRVVIPIRVEAKRRVDGFVHDVSASGKTVFIEPAASLESNNMVRELELEEMREMFAIRVDLTDRIRAILPTLSSSVDQLTRFDVLLAKATLSNELGARVPRVEQDGIVSFTDGRNPALALVFKAEDSSREVVPFSLILGEDHTVLIISGPNAGGKSVTMKAVGLMASMVQLGLPIPVGEESRFDLFSGIFVDIGDEQSLSDDLSTFTSHLKTLSHILETADRDSLVLIDEAGTGTDPEAGGALARAILESLHEKGVRTIVTTHYGPLKVFAHESEGIQNGSMMFDQKNLRPTFEFVPGIPGSSYATEIATRAGLPAAVISRSTDLMESGHASAEILIQDLMRRNSELAETLRDLDEMKGDVAERREIFQQRVESLQEERQNIRDDALRKADAIVRDANRAVERTIREIKESGADRKTTSQAREKLEKTKVSLARETKRSESKGRSRKRKKVSKALSAPRVAGPIRVGDQVRMIDGQTVGEVLELEGDQAVVAFASVQMKTEIERLIKVAGKPKQEVRVRKSSSTDSRLRIQSAAIRLDIRGRRVDEAFSEITPFVDQAMAAGIERAEVLHGKGTGALRSALHEYLANTDSVSHFEEAPINEGGAGVTLIYFK